VEDWPQKVTPIGVKQDEAREHERALVARAREGDMAAFEQLHRANVGRVYALCMRLTSDPQRSEELTQDVFVRAWQKLHTFRGESAFSSWLHPLTVNVTYSEGRSRRRWASRFFGTDDPAVFEDAAPGFDPADGMDIERALGTLPPGAREVFVLHDIEGYRHEEIGSMIGVATGTSKAQLHRARRLLRKALSQ
jgi:RNA polymerase sigma-70 factor (ECF subfamily)